MKLSQLSTLCSLLWFGSATAFVSSAFKPKKRLLANATTIVKSSSASGGGGNSTTSSSLDLKGIVEGIKSYDIDTVLSNLNPPKNEKIGSRGEVYFAAQAFLILSILKGGVPIIGEYVHTILIPCFFIWGFALVVLSLIDLGSDSLSPFPAPTKTGNLKTKGIYQQLRHPMYTGLLTIMLGLSLWTNSADRLLLTALLLYVIDIKSEKEEAFLLQEFPFEYPKYKVRWLTIVTTG